MLTMLLYVLIVGLVAALLFLVASAVFGRAEELGPLPEGTTETVLPAHDISGADVRDLRFQQVFRGYKAGEVDWALARLAARIDELETQLAQARGEAPRHHEAAEPVEQTGPGVIPGAWTGAHPAVEPPAGTPNPPGESRIERPGAGSSGQGGGTSGDTPGRSDGMHSSLAGLAVGYAPAAQSDTPGNPTGQIPWHNPAETGPWTPPALGTSTGPLPAPAVPGQQQPSSPFGPTPAPGPGGYSTAQNAYAPGTTSDQPVGFGQPAAPSTGSLSLPPATTTPTQSPHNQSATWPGQPGQTTPGQL
ncbi:DivIVA domain-containing protein [Nocardia vaccinii]|uniref:DivIVA domain-containing protein n=1 Tax=Nocardia vaccinii TaxID=1822 RepID=UPI000AC2D25A